MFVQFALKNRFPKYSIIKVRAALLSGQLIYATTTRSLCQTLETFFSKFFANFLQSAAAANLIACL